MRYLIFIFILTTIIMAASCDSGPKVIESESAEAETEATQGEKSWSPNDPAPGMQGSGLSDEHTVVVKEVLDTDRYSYLRVDEEGEEFWVAVSKMPVEVGETLYFKGGLLKRNFFSQEYNRVFEKLYLVSDIRRPMASSGSGSAVDEALGRLQGQAVSGPVNVEAEEGSVKIAEIFENRSNYDGKPVQVTGKVVKVNPNIMGRNWLHLQDGSGEELDLTVTTAEMVPLGHVVTLQGTIALNKDFGAGYRYDVIMENAKSVSSVGD